MNRAGRTALLLAAIAVVAVAVRLVYVTVVRDLWGPPEFDGITYDLIARNLLAGHGFGTEGPTAYRAPGYPLFVALVYALGGHSIAVLRIVQAVLGAATTVVTYYVCMLIFSRRRISLLAAALVALHPVLIYLTWMVYAETLAILLVMLALLLLLRIMTQDRWSIRSMAAMGGVFGLCLLTRPPLLIFIVLGIGSLWIVVRHHTGAVMRLAISSLITVLFILPWTIRNYVTFGEFIPLATSGGVNFWEGNNPLARGGAVTPSPATWRNIDPPPRDLFGWPDLTEKESERRFYRAGFNWILQNPLHALKLLPQKLARSWLLTFSNETRPVSVPKWVTMAYVCYPLTVLVGLLLSVAHWRNLVPVYCLLLGQTFLTLSFYGSSRLSAVMMPATLILSAFAIHGLLASVAGTAPRKRFGPPWPDNE